MAETCPGICSERVDDLESGIVSAESDLLLLENVIDRIEQAPDAFASFGVGRRNYTNRALVIGESELQMLLRVHELLRVDLREISKAFYATEAAHG